MSMTGKTCIINGCYSNSSTKKVGFFKFPPNDSKLLKKWLEKMKMPDWIPGPYDYICSMHFQKGDVDFSGKTPKLKLNVVPIIFTIQHFKSIFGDKLSIGPVNANPDNFNSIVDSNKSIAIVRKRKIKEDQVTPVVKPKVNKIEEIPKKRTARKTIKPQSSAIIQQQSNIRKQILQNKSITPEKVSSKDISNLSFDSSQLALPENTKINSKNAILKIQIDKIISKDSIVEESNQNYCEEIELGNVVIRFNSALEKFTVEQKNNAD